MRGSQEEHAGDPGRHLVIARILLREHEYVFDNNATHAVGNKDDRRIIFRPTYERRIWQLRQQSLAKVV